MPLEGKLNYGELADLLQVIDISRKTGILNITSRKGVGRLYFERGKLVRAESNLFSVRVGDVLMDQGVLSRDDVDKALAIQRNEGGKRKFGEIICAELGVEADDIQAALNDHFKAVVFDILAWSEGRIRFEVSEEKPYQERFFINTADFILDVGIEAGYLVLEGYT